MNVAVVVPVISNDGSNPVSNDGGEFGDDYVRKQLVLARNEISNLRQQIRALTNVHLQDVKKIQSTLDSYEESGCTCTAKLAKCPDQPSSSSGSTSEDCTLRSIGIVSTWFPEKKATPRQPGICIGSRGILTLSNTVFTNPEHALEGLDGFSHMWILFHFHKNDSTHVRAKVSPPRLNGARTGVFGTRSPHRPSPIGLSLVKIDKVEGSCIHFSGVDMVDGTPVLDIKPYIPQYDNPLLCRPPTPRGATVTLPSDMGEREAPDGEETAAPIRVPAWIAHPPVAKLSVVFGDRVELDGDRREAVASVLREDPRSVYLRDKWGDQMFTFLISGLHVSCRFDDLLHTATVFQCKAADKMCECGQPEWQCSLHGESP